MYLLHALTLSQSLSLCLFLSPHNFDVIYCTERPVRDSAKNVAIEKGLKKERGLIHGVYVLLNEISHVMPQSVQSVNPVSYRLV